MKTKETYLKLTEKEEEQLIAEVGKLPDAEKIMELVPCLFNTL